MTHIDGWDCSFTRDPEKWAPSARNDSTPEDLLRGFFKFYSKVNFADAVLCPRDGKVHTVAEFRQLTTVRPGQEDFKVRGHELKPVSPFFSFCKIYNQRHIQRIMFFQSTETGNISIYK